MIRLYWHTMMETTMLNEKVLVWARRAKTKPMASLSALENSIIEEQVSVIKWFWSLLTWIIRLTIVTATTLNSKQRWETLSSTLSFSFKMVNF